MWPKIEEFLPPAVRSHPDFLLRRGAFGVPMTVKLPESLSTRGGTLLFGSGEQSVMQFEGDAFTFAGLDEPPKRSVFSGIWRGLTDRYGRAWFSMTPLGPNATWLYEEFEAGDREDSIVIRGSVWDNPYISTEQKKEFLEGGGFLEEERAAREGGAWTFLTHRAFPQFDPAAHIIPPQEPPSGWSIGLAIDPAHRRPYALIWGAFGPDGDCIIFDEWPLEDHAAMRHSSYTVKDYVRLIINKEGTRRIDFRCLDPRFGAASPTIKGERYTSIQEDFAAENMHFDCRLDGTEREEIGIARIREMLRWDNKASLSPLNRPKLRVCSNCINTINALALSNFVPPSLRDPEILPEKLAEKNKDFRDALRYLILYPKLIDPDGGYMGYITPKDLAEVNYPSENDWF